MKNATQASLRLGNGSGLFTAVGMGLRRNATKTALHAHRHLKQEAKLFSREQVHPVLLTVQF
jgi:hypothetical protein